MTKVIKQNNDQVKFVTLQLLSTFIYCNNHYIKIGKNGNGSAIGLFEPPFLAFFNEDSMVVETDCVMHISDKK